MEDKTGGLPTITQLKEEEDDEEEEEKARGRKMQHKEGSD
jgi:hypothetical protein